MTLEGNNLPNLTFKVLDAIALKIVATAFQSWMSVCWCLESCSTHNFRVFLTANHCCGSTLGVGRNFIERSQHPDFQNSPVLIIVIHCWLPLWRCARRSVQNFSNFLVLFCFNFHIKNPKNNTLKYK